MNPAGLDHDTQRELEQRALRNVSWLAAKLGYQDALDRRQERWLMVAIAGVLVVIVAALALSAMRRSSADADDLARKRCEVDARVEAIPAVRQQVAAEYASLPSGDRDRIFEERLHTLAATKCAAVTATR